MYVESIQINFLNTKNRTASAVKPVSKQENVRFHPYINNGTFD